MNETISYAPVIIPTLCRYNHLKNLIESLGNCTCAKSTDVYISLDYPLKESHKEGYYSIRKYIHTDEVKSKFKNLFIIEQTKNIGASANINFLVNLVKNKYDKWIFTEDDNVFSPNFLDFINKGLELYKNDSTVLAINGYRQLPKLKTNGNTFIRQNVGFSAWGYGIWKDKYELLLNDIENNYFESIIHDYKIIKKIKRNGWNRLNALINIVHVKDKTITDWFFNIYMAAKDMDVIMPTISTVRNCGWDNSGINCSASNKQLAEAHMTQPIDDNAIFEYIGDPKYEYETNRKIFVKEGYSHMSGSRFAWNLLKMAIKTTIFK